MRRDELKEWWHWLSLKLERCCYWDGVMNPKISVDFDFDELVSKITTEVVEVLRPLIQEARVPEYVDGQEMSRLLSVSKSTLDRLRCENLIPSVKLQNRRLFCPSDVYAALAKQADGKEGG